VREPDLCNYQQTLFERVCSIEELQIAFKAVRRNRGAPGIDGVSVERFEEQLSEELSQLKRELESWSYKPSPVRRVEIPKPQGGVRLLGIPTVRDRVVHGALKAVLEPIWEPRFSEGSYGFRPGRNQRQAVEAAQAIVKGGKEYVVDIDLSRFFDRIHHDRLIYRLGTVISDKRILRLIGIILRSGVMRDGLTTVSTEGSVQGSPLSPLLSNVVLDELDKELESRGLAFCRFADDCNIFVASQKAAERVMTSVTNFIEKRLKLVVNQEKSKVALSRHVKFLGMTIVAATLAISVQSMARAMDKVRELTPRGSHVGIEKTMERVNEWYVGWASYYKMTQYPSQLLAVEAHIRRRLRCRLISQQKRRRHLYEKLVKRGAQPHRARVVYRNRKWWSLSNASAVSTVYSIRWFTDVAGQKLVSNQKQPHWFSLKRYIKLT
jgi:RNA-directed DNA polymerase